MAEGSDRWAAVEQVFHAALEQAPERRTAFLAEACASDADLRRDVEALLAQGASADGPLEHGALAAAAGLVSETGVTTLTGRRLGGYEILAPIGAGGMGEVYRARDTRLGRDVAVKILPRAFTDDPDRLSRFEREARVLAALNHPNVAAIHGFEEAGEIRALVLELVQGETLARRIGRGAGATRRGLSVKETLEIARQIADALDAAHEKGIVHRDLKPANIKITPDGVVKVLDFGLAKLDARVGDGINTQLPTVTIGGTREGLIVGTAAYMSPEQARGLPVDKRTDIWAFGCVLFEMLTGRIAFSGATLTDTLAAVVEREPDWRLLPDTTPAKVRRVLQRCLEKDPKRRFRDIADAAAEIGDTDLTPQAAPASTHSNRAYLPWSIAAVLFAALAIVVWSMRGSGAASSAPQSFTRTAIVLPLNQRLATDTADYPLALSPDGTTLAYVGEREGETQLYVREMSALEPRAIPGTTSARHPFFSPDGKWVGFFADGALQKVAVAGGVPLRICTVDGVSMGASWGPDDTIVWASRGMDLTKISGNGGVPQPLAGSSPAAFPEILSDGKTILFTTGAAGEGSGIAAMSLDGGVKRIIARTTDSSLDGPAVLGAGQGIAPVHVVASEGYLVYGQSQNPGGVRAIRFDPVSLTPKGPPLSLVDSVEKARSGGAVYFAVSATGLLLYAATSDRHQLVWADRNGTTTPISTDRAAFRIPRLSPDGSRVVVAINDETRRSHIWIYDTERGTKRRLTSEHNLDPVWTPDGQRVTFSSGGLVELSADGNGTREPLLSAEQIRSVLPVGTAPYATSWSPDGRELLFQADTRELWVLPRDGKVPRALLQRPFNGSDGQFSPDGRQIVYVSEESGRDQIYVRGYPDFVNPFVISTDGGTSPKWSRDGREIFYRQGDSMMAVRIDTIRPFHAEKPRRLFGGQFTGAARDPRFDVSPDGTRFVMIKSDEASSLRQITVVQNWFEALTRDASVATK